MNIAGRARGASGAVSPSRIGGNAIAIRDPIASRAKS
jgi:hypothetical protein